MPASHRFVHDAGGVEARNHGAVCGRRILAARRFSGEKKPIANRSLNFVVVFASRANRNVAVRTTSILIRTPSSDNVLMFFLLLLLVVKKEFNSIQLNIRNLIGKDDSKFDSKILLQI